MTDSSPTDLANTDRRSCRNCGQSMQGSYCALCGQQDKEVLRPFIFFLQEVLRVVFELDGRAYKTTFRLLTRPGFLTREYFVGRRVSYTPPLRLFLTISIGFFLIVSVVSTLRLLQDTMGEAVATQEAPAPGEAEGPAAEFTEVSEIDEDFADVLEFTSSVTLPFLDEQGNHNLQLLLTAQVRSNLEELTSDPRDFIVESLEYVTFFMLFMMPILALLQQIILVLCPRYYVEHLVLTLHNHAFLLLMIFITMVLGIFENVTLAYICVVAEWLSAISALWIFVYLFLSLKRYFQLGWFTATLAFSITSILYTIALAAGMFLFGMLFVIFA